MPKLLARNLTWKPFLVLTKVRTNCSHFVKTPSLLVFFGVAHFCDDFLVFLVPLQRRMSVAFGSKNSNSKSILDLVTPV